MLIVEGPDGAGKTTLIEKISGQLGWPVDGRVVGKDTEAFVPLNKWVDTNLREGFQRRIFDRHRLISEPIYGPIIRKRLTDGFDDLNTYHRWTVEFHALAPIVVFCMPSLETVRENCWKDDDNKTVRKQIDQIYWLYWAAMAQWRGIGFFYDYTKGDDDLPTLLYVAATHASHLLEDKDKMN